MKSKILLKYATASAMALFLMTVASVTVNAGGFDSDEIVLNLSFEQPVITQIIIDNESYDRVIIEGLPSIGDTGVPVLPVKPVNVLLPQRGVVESIDVVCNGYVSLGDGFNIELGVEPEEIGSHPHNQSNASINYNVTVPYPTENYHNIGIYNFRGYSILTLNVFPVYYIGETGDLYYYEEITVVIKTSCSGFVNPLFRGFAEDRITLQQKVDDQRMISTYVSRPSPPGSPIGGSSLVDPSDSFDYVIITSDVLKNANGDYTFQDLINYKNERCTRTTIVTIEDIVNDPYYWNNTNHLFNDTQARIRSFITDAYLNWGIEYVLIGGDNDIIPTKILCFRKYWDYQDQCWRYQYGPSDLYYACLDGTFNSDWDVHWGETDDGDDGGDIDLLADIYIGRACVGNVDEVSNFVMKTLTYEATHDSYLSNVLMAGEDLDPAPGWGGDLLDELIDGSTSYGYQTVGIPSNEYAIDTLYDRDWTDHNWPKSEIINRINNNVHIIHHHGDTFHNYDMKMFISDINSITNDKYFFIYSHIGEAGRFDDIDGSDCIAEHLTVKNCHGAFAGIWNSGKIYRILWGPEDYENADQKIARQFWDSIYGESQSNPRMSEIGAANQDSKEDNIYCILDWFVRYRYFDLNLFGDPQVSIKPAVIPAHDIAVDRLRLVNYKTYVPSNETFTVNAVVHNKGTQYDTTIIVNLSIDGTVIEDKLISLLSNEAELVSFDCSLPSGVHQIGVDVQPVAGEDIISNNALDMTIVAGPDVALLDVDISLPIYVNCSNEVLVTVGNLGVTDVSNVIVSLIVDSEVVNNTVISSISNGEIMMISLDWVPESSRWCNVSAFVEPVVDENYASNNYYDNIWVHSVDHIVYVDDDGCGDFGSIQEAIDWVGNGDVVFVYNGVYHENIVVKKPIALVGEDPENTIIDGCGGAYVVEVTVDGVNLSGFTIQNNISSSPLCSGIDVRSDYNVIENNIIANSQNISNELDIGILIVGNYNNVLRNTIYNIESGIVIGLNNNIISHNIINNTEYGIFIFSSCSNIVKNDIFDNGVGIYLDNNDNTFSENNIANNEIGIQQSAGCSNVFVGNNISYNGEGINITCGGSSEVFDNVFHHNNFINNTVLNAYDEGSNIWDDGIGEGNYWSDFEDNPGYPDHYDIPGGDNQDRYPLVDMCIDLGSKPGKPAQLSGPTSGFNMMSYTYSTNTTDPDGDSIYYWFDWGDGTYSDWIGPFDSGEECNISHVWDKQGVFSIRVKSRDTIGLESDWSDPFVMEIVNRRPSQPAMPDGETFGGCGGIGYSYDYTSAAVDFDGDRLYYWFEWGDGLCTGWMGPYASGEVVVSLNHEWQNPGEYSIIVKVKDSFNEETEWSVPLVVTMNGAPGKPDIPDGPTSIHRLIEYSYSTSTIDPEDEQVHYLWDWGDGTEEEWDGPWSSGETVEATHSWGLLDPGGDYFVKVQSKDVHGFKSVWSEQLIVCLPEDVPQPCFLAGTKITMANGSLKNIEDIVVGDMVISYDRINNISIATRVKKVYHHGPDEMADYYLIINGDLRVTPNHPLYIDDGWMYADDVEIGDCLFEVNGSNGSSVEIESIEKVFERVPTFNFEIASGNNGLTGVCTYFADGVLVHAQKDIFSIVMQEMMMQEDFSD